MDQNYFGGSRKSESYLRQSRDREPTHRLLCDLRSGIGLDRIFRLSLLLPLLQR